MAKPISQVTIIGFGSQAKAWALNLKDSKVEISIALRKNSNTKNLANSMGFKILELESEELRNSSLIVLLIPDDQHLNFLKSNYTFLKPGCHLVYAHGFSLIKHKLSQQFPQFHHSLLAPKAIASEVRYQYETKGKIGAAIWSDGPVTENEVRSLAEKAGITALYSSEPEEETKADLFSEQSFLCSVLPYVSLKSYNQLRKNGISREVAFMECFLELKSISQALVTLGPEAFFKLISPNALIGSQKGREILLGPAFDEGLNKLFNEIENKKFFEESEIDADLLREKVLKEWEKEELTTVYKQLKNDLIN